MLKNYLYWVSLIDRSGKHLDVTCCSETPDGTELKVFSCFCLISYIIVNFFEVCNKQHSFLFFSFYTLIIISYLP